MQPLEFLPEPGSVLGIGSLLNIVYILKYCWLLKKH